MARLNVYWACLITDSLRPGRARVAALKLAREFG